MKVNESNPFFGGIGSKIEKKGCNCIGNFEGFPDSP